MSGYDKLYARQPLVSLESFCISRIFSGLPIGEVELNDLHLLRPVENGDRDEALYDNADASKSKTGYEGKQQQQSSQGKDCDHNTADIFPAWRHILVPRNIGPIANVIDQLLSRRGTGGVEDERDQTALALEGDLSIGGLQFR